MALARAARCCAGFGRRSLTSSTCCRRDFRCPAVVTVHDLSFERDARADGPRGPARLPDARSTRGPARRARADRVGAHEARPRRALRHRPGEDRRHAERRRPGLQPGAGRGPGGYLLFVGAIQARKDPLAAVDAAASAGLPLVVAGPEKEPALAERAPGARRRRARLRRRATSSSSSTAARPLSSCRRATRDSACRCSRRWRAARPSSRPTTRRCGRSPETPRVYAPRERLGDGRAPGRRRARAPRRAPGLERARAVHLGARPHAARSRSIARCCSEARSGRRVARQRPRARRACCRRSRRRSTSSSSSPTFPAASARFRRRPPSSRTTRPLGFGANVNRGVARTSAELVCTRQPGRGARARSDRRARRVPGRAPARRRRRAARCCTPTATVQPSRRRFPTVAGTIVRRTPLRLVFDPYRCQRAHYHLGERPTEPVAGRLDARRLPDAAAHDVRRARRVRRRLLPLRRGHRPLLPRGADGLGALVRAGGGRRARAPGRHRPAVLHAADALALARDRCASCASIPSGCRALA